MGEGVTAEPEPGDVLTDWNPGKDAACWSTDSPDELAEPPRQPTWTEMQAGAEPPVTCGQV